MSCEPAVKEGTIPFVVEGETFHTWYKVVGNLSIITRPPLIVLHGGPGTSHDYMIPLADLASRPSPTAVIFYDQIGTARSTHLPHKPTAFWCIDLFVNELDNVLTYFGLTSKSYDILGHSWGGQLASEFFLRKRPTTLRRLILANTLAETVLRDEARWRLMRAIPADAQETIRRHEAAGDTLAPEYKLAWRKFYERYACILRPLPAELIHSIEQSEMNDAGGCVLNNMRNNVLEHDWDITKELHLIRVPTLLINGEEDYMTDEVIAPFFQYMDKVKWVKFANSSHVPHWEERERYMDVVDRFLQMP